MLMEEKRERSQLQHRQNRIELFDSPELSRSSQVSSEIVFLGSVGEVL